MDKKETQKEFYVGVAKEDITPELGCPLFGYPFERRAERVMDRLEVGVIAVRQEGTVY